MSPVANHPNRSKANRSTAANPTPEEIRALRERLGMTQTEAAAVIHANLRSWQRYEAQIGTPDSQRMHPGLWELFQLKTEHLRR